MLKNLQSPCDFSGLIGTLNKPFITSTLSGRRHQSIIRIKKISNNQLTHNKEERIPQGKGKK